MTGFVRNLEIKGFRALSELSIAPFGRVNLITGKNNAGKSSLLEAIRILVTGGALRTLFDILNYREELGASGESERTYLPTLHRSAIYLPVFPTWHRVSKVSPL